MTLFIDFDDCLFCTRDFVRDMKAVFARYGVDGATYDATRAAMFSDVAHESGSVYSPADHAMLLAQTRPLDADALIADLWAFYADTRQYVFPDAAPFLAAHTRTDLVILTYGSQEFQTAKIAGSGLADMVGEVIVTQGDKADVIADYRATHSLAADERIVFIDDRVGYLAPVKQRMPDVATVLLLRPEGRYHDTPDAACDAVATDFPGIVSVLALLK